MKVQDVRIGGTFLCRVGTQLVRVVVMAQHDPERWERKGSRITFVVRRENESKPLPKRRTAAALRPAPVKSVKSAFAPRMLDTHRLLEAFLLKYGYRTPTIVILSILEGEQPKAIEEVAKELATDLEALLKSASERK